MKFLMFFICFCVVYYPSVNIMSVYASVISPGQHNIDIVGGRNATRDELNFVVFIKSKIQYFGQSVEFGCGGSIISENAVLTAAHCLVNLKERKRPFISPKKVTVYVSSHSKNESVPEPYKILSYHKHPGFNAKATIHDIAILILARNITFGVYARKIPVATNTSLIPGTIGTIAGWGKTNVLDNMLPNQLLEANVTIYGQDIENCDVIDSSIQFCAGGRDVDACDGDSGGPFVCNEKEEMVCGIISASTDVENRCDGYGIYTKVSAYTDWINSHMEVNSGHLPNNSISLKLLSVVFIKAALSSV